MLNCPRCGSRDRHLQNLSILAKVLFLLKKLIETKIHLKFQIYMKKNTEKARITTAGLHLHRSCDEMHKDTQKYSQIHLQD